MTETAHHTMQKSTDPKTSTASPVRAASRPRLLKNLWRAIRKPLARSVLVKRILVELAVFLVRFTNWTNPLTKDTGNPVDNFKPHSPAILALWHGQHLMVPIFAGKGVPISGLFSRSADAELNAQIAQRLGLGVVRGSGGRDGGQTTEKGGARALIALKRIMSKGESAAMIADIPHGTPRQAGLGIVTLAKITGRPIIAGAYASSRRLVLEKTWDKTTINLPFGRATFVTGKPIFVASDADNEELERKRQDVTASLNEVTEEAYKRVDGNK